MKNKALSLSEYAKLHPTAEPEEQRNIRQAYVDRMQEQEEINRMKAGIIRRIESGERPQFILMTAVKALGMATNDPEFSASCTAALDAMYGDMKQETLFGENERVEADRQQAALEAYKEKTRRQVIRSMNGCRKIEQALGDVLLAINSQDPEDDTIL